MACGIWRIGINNSRLGCTLILHIQSQIPRYVKDEGGAIGAGELSPLQKVALPENSKGEGAGV